MYWKGQCFESGSDFRRMLFYAAKWQNSVKYYMVFFAKDHGVVTGTGELYSVKLHMAYNETKTFVFPKMA